MKKILKMLREANEEEREKILDKMNEAYYKYREEQKKRKIIWIYLPKDREF